MDRAKSEGYEMSYVVADVTSSDQLKGYVDKTLEGYQEFLLFFNNAGIDGEVNLVQDYSEEVFDKVMRVNVKRVLLGFKYVIPEFQDGGSIVITSSIAGLIWVASMVGYRASKHATIGIMPTAAKELSPRKIWINTVPLGFVNSLNSA